MAKRKPPARKPTPSVVLPVGQLFPTPPKGQPFTFVSGSHAPARKTEIPNLTAQVKLAKARKERAQQGGLLTPAQRAEEQRAAKTLAAAKTDTPPVRRTKPSAPAATRTTSAAPPATKKSAAPLLPLSPSAPFLPGARKPTSPPTLPPGLLRPSTAPFVVPPPSAPASATPLHPGPRRAQPAFGARGGAPHNPFIAPKSSGTGLGFLKDAVSVGLGTGLEVAASIPGTLFQAPVPRSASSTGSLGAPEAPISKVKPTHLGPALVDTTQRLALASNAAASRIQGAGLSLPKTIPSVDLVEPAGAAGTQMTPQKLVAAGLTEKQTKRFREKALKNGWYEGEINGLVGLDLIKHAYSDPPSMPLRILQNFGAGVVRTAGLPVVPVAAVQEISSGHGMRFAKQLGEVAASQLGGMAAHPGQAAVSDPYAFIPVAGGTLKTLGGIGGKIAEKAGREAAERSVTHAVTGAAINRGVRDRNLYTASGQLISDKLTARSPLLSRRADAQSVDKVVSDVVNATAPLHHGVQTDYAKALKSVGVKRAEVLASINKAGGRPEKILVKYKRDGNARQVKHWGQVVEASKNLSDKDREFLAAHRALGVGTTATHVELGRFSDTAGLYRSHQPLILSDARAGDPFAQRVEALHDEWVKALRTTDDQATLAPLFGAYDHAVREYAQKHLDEGGAEPTRVAYTPPPDTGVMVSPYRKGTGGKVRFNARVPKQKASTGGSFESGNYLIDPRVALRENLQAQRLRISIGLASDENLPKIGALEATRGDPRPAGYVFTPKQNPATVGKVISDLHDQPVGAHDYYHQEASIRDRFAKSLDHEADKTGEYAKTDGWFVPQGAWDRILEHTRPESRNAYDRFIRQYQRAMISIYPSTLLGNTVGSMPLGFAGGAFGKSYAMATRSSGLTGDASIVPHTLHGRGVAGNLAADVRNPVTRGMNKMRAGNAYGEDWTRDALYFSKMLPGSKKRAKELGYPDRDAYFRDVAIGKVDPQLRDAAIAHAVKFAGDAARPVTRAGRIAGRVVLFPQWLQHMSKLMLVTLPIHHPRRTILINALAAYGDQYRKEHGALPTWMQDFAPLLTHTVGGQEFTRVVGASQLAPQGTAGGVFDDLTRDQSVTDRLVGLANPPVGAVVRTILQERDNRTSPYPVDLGRFALNQAFYTLPGASKFFPRTGMESTSLPWSPQRYTIPYRDAAGGKHKLPWDKRMGPRPVGGALGIASRVFGLPLYDVPTPDSAANKREVSTKLYNAKHPRR